MDSLFLKTETDCGVVKNKKFTAAAFRFPLRELVLCGRGKIR